MSATQSGNWTGTRNGNFFTKRYSCDGKGLVWFECIDDLSAETSFLSPAAELSVHSCLTLLHGRTEEHSELEDKIPGNTESRDSSSLQTWVANSELLLFFAVFLLFPFLCLCMICVYVCMLVYMWARA